jgi:hypothetical protein
MEQISKCYFHVNNNKGINGYTQEVMFENNKIGHMKMQPHLFHYAKTNLKRLNRVNRI